MALFMEMIRAELNFNLIIQMVLYLHYYDTS